MERRLRGYIGTGATGRYRTYRYYTCWSRARYGTKAGCDVYRFHADEIETAIGTALLEFYTVSNSEVIAKAVADFQAQHSASSRDLSTPLTTVTRELPEATSAIDLYLTAFEKGTLNDDDRDVRARLAKLKDQCKQPRARRAQLEFELDQPPQDLTPGNLTKIRNQIRQILTEGAPPARKAMFEARIQEITIGSNDSVKPVFKLPLAGNK
jgi:site-specific DNA recombinase